MELTFKDKGNYFRGLLLLIGKDNLIHDKEKKEVLSICQSLGYEKEYCERAIQDILGNPYIPQSPPKFSSFETAKKFIKDAVNISLIDDELNELELDWLEDVVKVNGISKEWFNKLLSQAVGAENSAV